MKAIRDLFFDQLRELHGLATRVGTGLPPLGRLATEPRLASIIDRQGEDSISHYQALLAIFTYHDEVPNTGEGKALEAVLEESRLHAGLIDDPTARDINLVGHCLRLCHHQIASLVMARRLAQRLGWNEEAGILEILADEEILTAEELLMLEHEL
ncbi:MAG: DUF892 family protein [Verrucomicrobiaceae bacterium]|nr:MAG: DUF892 family protein [Verrucomicrobiaceae bacterium]